eukprot:3940324-Rhodomonas_salina.1
MAVMCFYKAAGSDPDGDEACDVDRTPDDERGLEEAMLAVDMDQVMAAAAARALTFVPPGQSPAGPQAPRPVAPSGFQALATLPSVPQQPAPRPQLQSSRRPVFS